MNATEREKESWDTNKKDDKTLTLFIPYHFYFLISVLDLYTY